jgi:Uma2 family endonuclease
MFYDPEKTHLYIKPLGYIVGLGISEEIYLRDYAEEHCDWIDGVVTKAAPIDGRHNELSMYLLTLLSAYFELYPIGKIFKAPFLMRFQMGTSRRYREPDCQIVLNENPKLTEIYVDGAPDIAIEITTIGSSELDYGMKCHEYEQAGVREYWIIDPLKKEARFYRLNEKKAYELQNVEEVYDTPLIPKLKVSIASLWQDSLPGPASIVQEVMKMLED